MQHATLSLFGTAALCLLFVFGAPKPVQAQDPFTRITSSPVVSGINSTILAWGDFNNDGFQDLYISTRTGPSLLYSNKGDGTFAQVLSGPVVADSGSCFGATWGDYDNDGFLDLFVGVNNGGNDWLYHNDGHGNFTKIATGTIVSSGGNANNCGWADYDNDGFLDLFVANSDQNDFLYHNNGNGQFTRVLNNSIAQKPGNSQGGSWADYDNDGWPDLFVSRVNEPNLLYHNEGQGVFTPVTNGIIVHDISVGQGTSWGDYDNDGYLDLFVVNPNAPNFLYHNNGDGSFTKITNAAIVTDIGNGHGCAWGDYDNDGYLDLFVANRLGVNFLYHNTGHGTFTRVTDGIVPTDSADAVAAAWADYDNDGFLDLCVTELNSFNNRLYRNNGNSNHWLNVECSGRISNRAAIGAKIRVKATLRGQSMWQLREISGGGGLGSQNDLRASFGLADATQAEVVRVEWPSGIVQERTNVSSGQFLRWIEPEARIEPVAMTVGPGESATFRLLATNTSRWQLQWLHDGIELPGQTNATLVIPQVQAGDGGSYRVLALDPETGISFRTAPGRLNGPVIIAQQPRDTFVRPGSNAWFSVTAIGLEPLSYQWRWNGVVLPGETNAVLTVSNAQLSSEGAYDVVVGNPFGTIQSATATVGILINPQVTVHPLSQSVVAGGSITFSTAITGNPAPFTYEWRRGSVVIWTNTTSERMSFFTLSNVQSNQAGNYRVIVKNAANNVPGVASSIAGLSVLADRDGDGLPDDWESTFGLNPDGPDDVSDDDDGDGLSTQAEYLAGTDPHDRSSALRIEVVDSGRSLADGTTLRFEAVANRTYTVQRSSSLANPSWQRVADIPATATNRVMTITDLRGPGAVTRFYRVVTPRSP